LPLDDAFVAPAVEIGAEPLFSLPYKRTFFVYPMIFLNEIHVLSAKVCFVLNHYHYVDFGYYHHDVMIYDA
jgi:hypothetical protein